MRRALGWLVVGVLTIVGAGLLALRLFPRLQLIAAGPMVSAFAPYALFTWTLVALLLLALSRRGRSRWLLLAAAAAGLLAGVHASWLVPFYVADATPSGGRPITIASANIFHHLTDPDALARQTAAADIVIVLEYDPVSAQILAEHGWQERYPHQVGAADAGAAGTMIFSRFPITQLGVRPSGVQIYTVGVSPPDGPPFVLVAAHPLNPAAGAVLWRAYGDLVTAAVTNHPEVPLIVVGDFNATPDQITIRSLVAQAGVRNVADESGSGWLRTWPAGHWGPLPPLLSLDQAFVRGSMYADRITTFPIVGSDHRGIIVRARVAASRPRPPGTGLA